LVVEHGREHEIVVDVDVAETLSKDRSYRDPVRDLVESERCDIRVSERPVPFYLGLANDTVQIGVGDDEETPQGLAESTEPDVWEWAERTYADYRADAEPLTTRGTTPETA
jgi:predicted transcriptional regulator